MVAVAQLMPEDPEDQRTVLGVLREHPELPGFIDRATERARDVFTDPEIYLDTVRYDDWDSPLPLIIRASTPWSLFEPISDEYLHRLHGQPKHDEDLNVGFFSIRRSSGQWLVTRGRDFLKVDAFLEDRHDDEFVRTRIGREHRDVPRLLSTMDPDLSSSIRFLRNLRYAADYEHPPLRLDECRLPAGRYGSRRLTPGTRSSLTAHFPMLTSVPRHT